MPVHTPSPTRRQALRAVLRINFEAFVMKVFEELNPRKRFKPNWHIKALCHTLMDVTAGRTKDLIINVPPRSLKSLIVSVAYVAFELGRDPTKRFLCVSYAQDLAETLSQHCRKVMTSDWYLETFSTRLVTERLDQLITTKGGGRRATSIGGTQTGLGGDIIILDDPLKPEEAFSEAQRNRVNDYFQNTLSSRLDDKTTGQIILVMQRLHANDLSGFLLEQDDGFHLLSFPAQAVKDEVIAIGPDKVHQRRKGEVLHPDREPIEVLERQRRRMGSANYEAQYQQDPTPPGGLLVKAEWLRYFDDAPPREGAVITQSWDTAMKGDPSSDFSCCTTWVEYKEQHYLIDVFCDRLSYPELRKRAAWLYDRYRPNAVLIETKATGDALIADLRIERPGIPAIGRNPTLDKECRFSATTPLFEAGLVRLPKEAPWLERYKKELFRFPKGNDDQADSTSQYLNYVNERRGRVIFEWDFLDVDPRSPLTGAPDPSVFCR